MQEKPQIDEIENEAKSLLSKNDYEKLLIYFKIKQDAEFLLKNYYFDTMVSMKISRNFTEGTTLRIRESLDGDVLQFKFPISKGVTEEYKDDLDINSKSILLSEGIIPLGNVRDKLKELGIMELYTCLGSLANYRVQVTEDLKGCKVFLDRVIYMNGMCDYEIEVEGPSIDKAEETLFEILEINSINRIPAVSKFQRFMERI